jgi:hypothetical protein
MEIGRLVHRLGGGLDLERARVPGETLDGVVLPRRIHVAGEVTDGDHAVRCADCGASRGLLFARMAGDRIMALCPAGHYWRTGLGQDQWARIEAAATW